MNNKPAVTLYGNSMCPYCGAARMLLTTKAIKFEDISVSSDPDKFAEMQRRSGSRKVPQIFIGGTHVGGFDELSALDRSGKLDEMLASQA
jgi:glutaredoxin 3